MQQTFWDILRGFQPYSFLLIGGGVRRVEDSSGAWLERHKVQGLVERADAELADAQAEIARLRGALKRCREAFDSCTPGDYSTGHVIHPYFDEDAVNAAQDLLDGLGI